MIKYTPIISVFTISFLMTMNINPSFMTFMGIFLCILSCLKIMDINSFVKEFTKYDILSKKIPSYSYIFPLLELYLGLNLLLEKPELHHSILLIIIGTISIISIIYTKYIKKESHTCACVGGKKNMPLGIFSLIENLGMVIMGFYIIYIYTFLDSLMNFFS